MFVNEVFFEARGISADGVEIIVKEIASATSEISYEDAWFKAHALAKEKAEATLVEKLKLLTSEVKEKLVYLKGERGCVGSRGPQGAPGSSSSYNSYSGFQGSVSSDIADQLNQLIALKASSSQLKHLTASKVPPPIILPTKNDLKHMKLTFDEFSAGLTGDEVVMLNFAALTYIVTSSLDTLATEIIGDSGTIPLLQQGFLKITKTTINNVQTFTMLLLASDIL